MSSCFRTPVSRLQVVASACACAWNPITWRFLMCTTKDKCYRVCVLVHIYHSFGSFWCCTYDASNHNLWWRSITTIIQWHLPWPPIDLCMLRLTAVSLLCNSHFSSNLYSLAPVWLIYVCSSYQMALAYFLTRIQYLYAIIFHDCSWWGFGHLTNLFIWKHVA